jgi:tight adherence protein B
MDAGSVVMGLLASLSVGAVAVSGVLGAAAWSRDRALFGRLTRYVVPYLPQPAASSLDTRFEKMVGRLPLGQTLLRDLSQLGIDARPGRLLVYGFIIGLGAWGAATFRSGSALIGAAAFLSTMAALFALTRWKASRSWERYRVQLPEALHVISSALSAGASLNQALKHASREVVPPLQGELKRLVEDVEVGKTLEEALVELRGRIPLSDFDMIIASLLIQQRSGGNLAELLNETAHILKQSQSLRQEMGVLTSQARLSAQLIGLLPVGLFAYMYFTNPGYLKPMLTNGVGQALLGIGIALEVVGYVVVMRIATYSEYDE